MPYILLCRDRDDAGDLRARTRENHLAYIGASEVAVLLAGPTLGVDGNPDGSMIIIDAVDESAAKIFADNDPYAKVGLFAEVSIKPYRIVTGVLAPAA